MPPVFQFEFTSDDRLVAEPRHGFILRDRIDIHAVLRQRLRDSIRMCVPEQSAGANQCQGAGGLKLVAPFNQPIDHLLWMSELTLRHSRDSAIR